MDFYRRIMVSRRRISRHGRVYAESCPAIYSSIPPTDFERYVIDTVRRAWFARIGATAVVQGGSIVVYCTGARAFSDHICASGCLKDGHEVICLELFQAASAPTSFPRDYENFEILRHMTSVEPILLRMSKSESIPRLPALRLFTTNTMRLRRSNHVMEINMLGLAKRVPRAHPAHVSTAKFYDPESIRTRDYWGHVDSARRAPPATTKAKTASPSALM